MASYFNSTTTIHTSSPIPAHITKTQVLTFLHNPEGMIRMNPIVTSVTPLTPAESTAFYSHVPAEHQPLASSTLPVPIFSVTEDMSTETPDKQAAGNWRGGWAKRFIPEKITYQTTVEARDDGMKSLTHAAMGVQSVTHWVVKGGKGGEEGAEGLVVEKMGAVTSNRMLMGFIATTLEESHGQLARDFVVALEKWVAGLEAGKDS